MAPAFISPKRSGLATMPVAPSLGMPPLAPSRRSLGPSALGGGGGSGGSGSMSPAAAAAAAAGLGMNPLQIQTAPSMTDLVDEEQSEPRGWCWCCG